MNSASMPGRRGDGFDVGERGPASRSSPASACLRWPRAGIPVVLARALPASCARCGPQLRSPSGGYLAAATKARASAAVLIIGAMMASAPQSSDAAAPARNRSSGTRTTGARAAMAHRGDGGEGRRHVPLPCWLIDIDGLEAFARRPLGDQPARPARTSRNRRFRRRAGERARAKATSAALLDLLDRLRQQFVHLGADLRFGAPCRRGLSPACATTSSSPAASKSAITTSLA